MNIRVETRDPTSKPTEPLEPKPDRTPQIVSMLSGEVPAKQEKPIPVLPRIMGDIQKDEIWNRPPPPKTITDKVGIATSHLAEKYGNTPSQPFTGDGRRLLNQAKSKVLTPEQEKALTPQGIWVALFPYVSQFLQSPVGWPFRQEFRRRIAAVVLGKPYGDVGIIVDAVDALARFSVCSLKEDIYGNVQKDIPEIIKLLTKSITGLEAMRSSFGVHWTDVEGKKESPETDVVMAALRRGLGDVLAAFGDYFDDMKMKRADVRAAREAVIGPQAQREEMRETRKGK